MENSTSLSQDDVDLLFQIEHGRHETIELDVASRFVVLGFLRSIPDEAATQSLTSTGVNEHRIYLDLTMARRRFLAEVRDGLTNFSESA